MSSASGEALTVDPALPLLVAAGILLVLLLWIAISYNRFVSQRNLVRDSWANVDTELRRRYDLIPPLVEAAKGYAKHESELFERLATARANAVAQTGPPVEQAATENALVGALRQLFAVVENYPQLKASEHFLTLQAELAITEDRIQAARRFFNNNVRDYNIRVESVPSNIIASMFKFRRTSFFEVEPAIRIAPDADLAPH